MALEVITKDELRDGLKEFKAELLTDIKALLAIRPDEPKKWIKSYQVKNMLKISPNTLQKLRLDGTLKYTKIGGILYYDYDDILKVMEGKPTGK